MINITSINKEGQIIQRMYDNKIAKFKNLDGTFVDIANLNKPRIQQNQGSPFGFGNAVKQNPVASVVKKYDNRLSDMSKVPDMRILKIQLGLSCNYSCSYCKQSIHVAGAEKSSMADVKEFIENFDTWCKNPKDDPIQIQLWGGEPLIYFAKIKLLVPFLRERFTKARISVLSNGSLVSEKVVEYFLEHDIVLAISHDGPGQLDTRKEDPLKEGSESFKWIKEYVARSKNTLYVNMVLSKQNHNAKEGVDFIKSKLGYKVQVGYEGIVNVEEECQFADDELFNEEDYYELRNTFKDAILNGEVNNIIPFNVKIDSIINSWFNPQFSVHDKYMQKCGMDDPWTLAVTLKGDALVCHSVNTPIGTVYDFSNIDLAKGGVKHWSSKEECRTCPVLNMCYGACMNLHGNAWYHTCNNEFHFNLSIFEAAFEMVFGEKIIDISGNIVRPKKVEVTNEVALPMPKWVRKPKNV